MESDIIIIGAGCVGLSTAWELLQQYPNLNLIVLEKEKQIAAHQTGHNSGVIHSGLYYRPETKRAQLCVQGRTLLTQFAEEHKVPYEICGKVVVAVDEKEIPQLKAIYQRGLQNGLSEIRMIDAKELKEIEPYCEGVQAIWVPYAGIIDFVGVCKALAQEIQQRSSNPQAIALNHEVKSIHRKNGKYVIKTSQGTFQSRYLVVCGGLQSDRLARMEGIALQHRIVGFRGDYYKLRLSAQKRVRNLIYPVPNPKFPFLGVHFTRMVTGEIECGPNAVFAFAREGYKKLAFDCKDTWEALSFIGTWRFFFKHWRFGLEEYRRAFSKKRFYEKVRRLIPSLHIEELEPWRCGIRAMALSSAGEMIDEFLFAQGEASLHVVNAPSPAATACLAIAKHIVKELQNRFQL